jgi:hypothetical protein
MAQALALGYSEAPNLAPAKPLEPLARERADDQSVWIDDPLTWFKGLRDELLDENARVWKDHVLLWEMIFLFIEGKQLLKRARYGAGWRAIPLPDRTDSPVYSYNLIGFYSDNIKSKWTNSNTDVKWRPTSDADAALGAAKAATQIHEYYKRKLYTETFRQTEALLAQCGKYARYYYYSKDAKTYGRRQQVEQQTLQLGDSTYFCADCGASGVFPDTGRVSAPAGDAGNAVGNPANDRASGMPTARESPDTGMALGAPSAMPEPTGISGEIPHAGMESPNVGRDVFGAGLRCPDCGSPNIEVEQAEPFTVEAVTGYEEVEMGSICCESVPAFELKHDLQFLPHESPYLIRTRRVRTSVLQSKFPFIKIKKGRGALSGLDAAEDLKKSTYASNTRYYSGREESIEPTTDFIQIWLDPAMYEQYALKNPCRTASGMEIPGGTRLIDLFPDGLYLCFIQGVDGVVEMRNEHHRDYWVGQAYRPRAISALGSGVEDMLEGNRQFNLTMSLIYTVLRTLATPATLYDESLLPNGVSAYLGNPLKNIPVDVNRLDGRSIRDAVHQLSPQPPSQQHFAYAQQLDYFLQKASRVTDFSGGLPGVNNETATGAEIASANAQSLFAPQLALKAEVDRRGAEIVLELFRKYCIDEVYISLSGKRGRQDGVWLSAADLQTDLFAEVVPESYLPQTNLERRQRFKGLLADVGGLAGLKMAMAEAPALLEKLAETYDVDLGAEDYTAAAETARERIEQMKAAIPMLQVAMSQMPPVQMAPDPMTGRMTPVPVDPMAEAGRFLLDILNPPIEIEEFGHLAAINYYRSWLTEDEAKEAPPELRAGVKAAIYRHIEGLISEARMTGMIGMAGAPPPPSEEPPPPEDRKNRNPSAKQIGGGPRPGARGVSLAAATA